MVIMHSDNFNGDDDDDDGGGPITRKSGGIGPGTTTTVTNSVGRWNDGGKLESGVNNSIDNIITNIDDDDVSILLNNCFNSSTNQSNHNRTTVVRTRHYQNNEPSSNSKVLTTILQKQRRLRKTPIANRIRSRTMLVALLLMLSSMTMLMRFLPTSDGTGTVTNGKTFSSVEKDKTKLMPLPQFDVVPMYVHSHHNHPGVQFVSALNNNLSMKSSSSSISSTWRSTSPRTRHLHQMMQYISPNDRYNCNYGQFPRRKFIPCPLMSTTDENTLDEDKNKDEDNDRIEEMNDTSKGMGDNFSRDGSSGVSASNSSSSSRVEVTPVRRALVNMLIMMTSPFPEIRSALKIRPKQRQRKSQIRNGYAGQTGSGSKIKSSSTVSYTAEPTATTTAQRPSFIERYWKPLAGLLYVCLGVLVYDVLLEKQQHWSMVDAIYFAMTCFTTVGYGDLVPSTYLGKFFTCLYGFTGIALLGALVASIGSKLFHLELDAINNVKKQSQQQVVRFYEKMPHVLERYKQHQKQKKERKNQKREGQLKGNKSNQQTNDQLLSDEKEIEAKAGQSRNPFQQAQYRIVWNALKSVASPLAVILSSGMIMGKIEQWNVLDSFYYALVTGTTIGLGDFSPQTRMGKMVAIVVIPVLVGATGEILAGIGVALLRRRQRKIFDEQANGSFTIEDIEKMDENHNGQVSKYEYTLYMLLQMDLVTKDEVDDLYEQFSRLDVTKSGYIDAEDLKVMAKLRQEQEQQKL